MIDTMRSDSYRSIAMIPVIVLSAAFLISGAGIVRGENPNTGIFLLPPGDTPSPRVSYFKDTPQFRSLMSLEILGAESGAGIGLKFLLGPEVKRIFHFGLGGDFAYFGESALFGVSANGRIYPWPRQGFPYFTLGLGYGWGDVDRPSFEKGVFFIGGAGIGLTINKYSGSRLQIGAFYRLQQYNGDNGGLGGLSCGFLL
jgi:hypothetical protein